MTRASRSIRLTAGRVRRLICDRSIALLGNRDGAAAVIVAVTLPAMLIGMALAVETSLKGVRESQMQGVADAAAGVARQVYDPFSPGYQQAPVDAAVQMASNNMEAATVAPGDVVQGWWDITKQGSAVDKFGSPIDGQVAGTKFSNAIRVTTRLSYPPLFGRLLGVSKITISHMSTGYKCSNLDYPYTLVKDDVPSPALPAIWMSWATPGHDADTSYYYEQPNGARNPVFKFYSPYDGEDVSFVLYMSNNSQLQVDTYCRGTYLVSPSDFDTRSQGFRDGNGQPVTITGYVLRGSTNNSFDTYHDQTQYPFAFAPTPYNTAKETPAPQYDLSKIHTTPYPSSNGIHYWASAGDPTPDRRTLLVYGDKLK